MLAGITPVRQRVARPRARTDEGTADTDARSCDVSSRLAATYADIMSSSTARSSRYTVGLSCDRTSSPSSSFLNPSGGGRARTSTPLPGMIGVQTIEDSGARLVKPAKCRIITPRQVLSHMLVNRYEGGFLLYRPLRYWNDKQRLQPSLRSRA
jgi:hypothetical protein